MKLGISQARIAELLTVSRSLYGMAELGRRQLPEFAYQRLLILSQEPNSTNRKNQDAEVLQKERRAVARQALMRNTKACMIKIRHLNRKLKRMHQSYERAKKLEDVSHGLKQTDAYMAAWGAANLSRSRQICRCTGIEAQTMLQLRIRVLEAEVEIAMAMAREMSENKND